jgi:hypothetical protein
VSATGGNGNIYLYAGDSVNIAAGQTVSAAGSGAITARAGEDWTDTTEDGDGTATGRFAMALGSSMTSADGNINVWSPGTSAIALLDANSNLDGTLGNVFITSTGSSITDVGGAGNNNVTAGTLTASAVSGIELDTTVATLAFTNSTSGAVTLREADGATMGGTNSGAGVVTLSSTTGNIVISSVTSSGNVVLNAGDDITHAGRNHGECGHRQCVDQGG